MKNFNFRSFFLGPFLACVFLFGIGCTGSLYSAQLPDLTRRAAFDLDCDESRLRVANLGGGARGVSGCGRRATYVESCNGQPGNFGTTCGWVLNSAENPRGNEEQPND